MQMILVRHYKTAGNAANEIIGWTDSPPAAGWNTDLAYVSKRLIESNIAIDGICTSKLKRARKTGEVYANNLSIRQQWNTEALNEVNYGAMSKKNKCWVKQNLPWHKVNPAKIYPGGESFLQMQRRSVSYITWLARKHSRGSFLVVAHAGVIRALVCHFLELEFAANLKQEVGHRYIGQFQIESGCCLRYRELGKPSGFVSSETIDHPWQLPTTDVSFSS